MAASGDEQPAPAEPADGSPRKVRSGPAPRGKKRKLAYRSSELSVAGKRYRGRLASRASLELGPSPFTLSGEGEGGAAGSGSEEPSGSEGEGLSGSESELRQSTQTGSEGNGVGEAEDEKEKLRREVELLQKEEREAARRLIKAREEDLEKARAVKEQKALYDAVLGFRIRLQPALNLVMRFPRPSNFSKYAAMSSKIAETRAAVETLLKSLHDAHKSVITQNGILEGYGQDGEKGDAVEQEGEDATFAALEELQGRIMEWKNGEVDRWGRKVDEATGRRWATKSRFTSMDLSVSGQIRATLKDRERLLKRTRRVRGKVEVIGEGELEDEVDREHFCDADFYQGLLRDVIERTEGGVQEMISLRRGSRNRKKIDRKASKGRKVRYNVHEKLVGFLAPVPFSEPAGVEELVKGLFGRRQKLSRKEEEH